MSEQHIELAKAKYPYLIQQENTPIRSLITLTRTRRDELSYQGEGTLFYLVNGQLQVNSDAERPGLIEVNHTFATDDEDDTAKIAFFEVQLVKFVSSYNHHMNFQGLLTKVQFWPDVKGVENPFAGAVEKKGKTEFGYTKNTGYPYTPPDVIIPRLTLPMVVDISVDTATEPERFAKWLKKAMASHKKERLTREREARKKAKEEAEKAAARKRRREAQLAWVATEEGQEYERSRAVFNELQGAAQKQAWLETESGKRFEALREILFDIEG